VTKVIPLPLSISISAGIRWSPDGRQLSFVEIGKDGTNIWNQPLDGSASRKVTQLHGATLFDFDWSRDGKQLVFRQGSQARDVVLIQDARSN
jgi:Tol biopolymer transport system component